MSEIQVNTINEYTGANGVTIDGLKIKDVTSGSVMSKPVLQVVTGTTTTDTGALAVTSFTDTGLSASITPTSTSSKILVVVNQTLSAFRNSGNLIAYLNIVRGSTEVWEGYYASTGFELNQVTAIYLDSPSTTSATTYKTQIKGDTTSDSASVRANQDASLSNRSNNMHLIEIAG